MKLKGDSELREESHNFSRPVVIYLFNLNV